MYTILLVDDEPLICKGLSRLLEESGLPVQAIFTSLSGPEALDYLRIEDIDLLITDIQMPGMTGIELMHQAKIIKPWVQTIVVSAHETFQYAQMAMRLGAKDYLIKPLNNEQFLDTVRDVLLKAERSDPEKDVTNSFIMRERFRMDEPQTELTQALNLLLTEAPRGLDMLEPAGIFCHGPYYAVIKLRLRLHGLEKLKAVSDEDIDLLRYAVLNIVNELLDAEWGHQAFYTAEDELSVILQWDESRYRDAEVSPITQLEMLARSMLHNIQKYLGITGVAGISQVLMGIEYLPLLNEQSRKAIYWNRSHRDHDVFYYGDLKWDLYAQDPTEEEVSAQNNQIVQRAKSYIDEHYAKNGLTLLEVAQHIHVSPNYLSYLYKKYMD